MAQETEVKMLEGLAIQAAADAALRACRDGGVMTKEKGATMLLIDRGDGRVACAMAGIIQDINRLIQSAPNAAKFFLLQAHKGEMHVEGCDDENKS